MNPVRFYISFLAIRAAWCVVWAYHILRNWRAWPHFIFPRLDGGECRDRLRGVMADERATVRRSLRDGAARIGYFPVRVIDNLIDRALPAKEVRS